MSSGNKLPTPKPRCLVPPVPKPRQVGKDPKPSPSIKQTSSETVSPLIEPKPKSPLSPISHTKPLDLPKAEDGWDVRESPKVTLIRRSSRLENELNSEADKCRYDQNTVMQQGPKSKAGTIQCPGNFRYDFNQGDKNISCYHQPVITTTSKTGIEASDLSRPGHGSVVMYGSFKPIKASETGVEFQRRWTFTSKRRSGSIYLKKCKLDNHAFKQCTAKLGGEKGSRYYHYVIQPGSIPTCRSEASSNIDAQRLGNSVAEVSSPSPPTQKWIPESSGSRRVSAADHSRSPLYRIEEQHSAEVLESSHCPKQGVVARPPAKIFPGRERSCAPVSASESSRLIDRSADLLDAGRLLPTSPVPDNTLPSSDLHKRPSASQRLGSEQDPKNKPDIYETKQRPVDFPDKKFQGQEFPEIDRDSTLSCDLQPISEFPITNRYTIERCLSDHPSEHSTPVCDLKFLEVPELSIQGDKQVSGDSTLQKSELMQRSDIASMYPQELTVEYFKTPPAIFSHLTPHTPEVASGNLNALPLYADAHGQLGNKDPEKDAKMFHVKSDSNLKLVKEGSIKHPSGEDHKLEPMSASRLLRPSDLRRKLFTCATRQAPERIFSREAKWVHVSQKGWVPLHEDLIQKLRLTSTDRNCVDSSSENSKLEYPRRIKPDDFKDRRNTCKVDLGSSERRETSLHKVNLSETQTIVHRKMPNVLVNEFKDCKHFRRVHSPQKTERKTKHSFEGSVDKSQSNRVDLSKTSPVSTDTSSAFKSDQGSPKVTLDKKSNAKRPVINDEKNTDTKVNEGRLKPGVSGAATTPPENRRQSGSFTERTSYTERRRSSQQLRVMDKSTSTGCGCRRSKSACGRRKTILQTVLDSTQGVLEFLGRNLKPFDLLAQQDSSDSCLVEDSCMCHSGACNRCPSQTSHSTPCKGCCSSQTCKSSCRQRTSSVCSSCDPCKPRSCKDSGSRCKGRETWLSSASFHPGCDPLCDIDYQMFVWPLAPSMCSSYSPCNRVPRGLGCRSPYSPDSVSFRCNSRFSEFSCSSPNKSALQELPQNDKEGNVTEKPEQRPSVEAKSIMKSRPPRTQRANSANSHMSESRIRWSDDASMSDLSDRPQRKEARRSSSSSTGDRKSVSTSSSKDNQSSSATFFKKDIRDIIRNRKLAGVVKAMSSQNNSVDSLGCQPRRKSKRVSKRDFHTAKALADLQPDICAMSRTGAIVLSPSRYGELTAYLSPKSSSSSSLRSPTFSGHEVHGSNTHYKIPSANHKIADKEKLSDGSKATNDEYINRELEVQFLRETKHFERSFPLNDARVDIKLSNIDSDFTTQNSHHTPTSVKHTDSKELTLFTSPGSSCTQQRDAQPAHRTNSADGTFHSLCLSLHKPGISSSHRSNTKTNARKKTKDKKKLYAHDISQNQSYSSEHVSEEGLRNSPANSQDTRSKDKLTIFLTPKSSGPYLEDHFGGGKLTRPHSADGRRGPSQNVALSYENRSLNKKDAKGSKPKAAPAAPPATPAKTPDVPPAKPKVAENVPPTPNPMESVPPTPMASNSISPTPKPSRAKGPEPSKPGQSVTKTSQTKLSTLRDGPTKPKMETSAEMSTKSMEDAISYSDLKVKPPTESTRGLYDAQSFAHRDPQLSPPDDMTESKGKGDKHHHKKSDSKGRKKSKDKTRDSDPTIDKENGGEENQGKSYKPKNESPLTRDDTKPSSLDKGSIKTAEDEKRTSEESKLFQNNLQGIEEDPTSQNPTGPSFKEDQLEFDCRECGRGARAGYFDMHTSYRDCQPRYPCSTSPAPSERCRSTSPRHVSYENHRTVNGRDYSMGPTMDRSGGTDTAYTRNMRYNEGACRAPDCYQSHPRRQAKRELSSSPSGKSKIEEPQPEIKKSPEGMRDNPPFGDESDAPQSDAGIQISGGSKGSIPRSKTSPNVRYEEQKRDDIKRAGSGYRYDDSPRCRTCPNQEVSRRQYGYRSDYRQASRDHELYQSRTRYQSPSQNERQRSRTNFEDNYRSREYVSKYRRPLFEDDTFHTSPKSFSPRSRERVNFAEFSSSDSWRSKQRPCSSPSSPRTARARPDFSSSDSWRSKPRPCSSPQCSMPAKARADFSSSDSWRSKQRPCSSPASQNRSARARAFYESNPDHYPTREDDPYIPSQRSPDSCECGVSARRKPPSGSNRKPRTQTPNADDSLSREEGFYVSAESKRRQLGRDNIESSSSGQDGAFRGSKRHRRGSIKPCVNSPAKPNRWQRSRSVGDRVTPVAYVDQFRYDDSGYVGVDEDLDFSRADSDASRFREGARKISFRGIQGGHVINVSFTVQVLGFRLEQ